MQLPRVYLSRRNLLALLSKLDRRANGEATTGAIIKSDNQHPTYPQTMSAIEVYAVEDDEYYIDRPPGAVHPNDRPATLTSRP